jgi:hypothetical protein
LGGAGHIHGWLDRLAAEYSVAPYDAEIAAAREDYFTRSGKVFEDDAELFEARLASFLEWYVVERPLAGGPPPALRALERALAGDGDAREDVLALAYLAASHRSLFHLTAIQAGQIELEDVLGGARFVVIERRGTIGFEVGSLLEARVVWDGRQLIFAKTFLFHPADARDVALDAVDAAIAKGAQRDEIMFSLCRLHVRWHRAGHLAAARVYRGG